MFVLVFCIYLYNLWGWHLYNGRCDVKDEMSNFLNNVAPWFTAALYSYLPQLIIFFTSSAIVYRLSQASAQRMVGHTLP